MALGESDVVAIRVPVAPGSVVGRARSLAELQLDIEPGFHVLAIRRDNRYLYRPRGCVVLQAGDELIATGPHEGRTVWRSCAAGRSSRTRTIRPASWSSCR